MNLRRGARIAIVGLGLILFAVATLAAAPLVAPPIGVAAAPPGNAAAPAAPVAGLATAIEGDVADPPVRFGAATGGYHTVEEVAAALDAHAAASPDLAAVFQYGDSWDRLTPGGPDGYALRGITLSNRFRPGPKPALVVLAAVHGREIAGPEIALRLIDDLLGGYGVDPEATWLLDDHQIIVFPLVNPDARKDVERGILQRKNRNTVDAPCPTDPPSPYSQPGVDLNRNFPFKWATLNSPADDPCGQTHGGPGPGSEPETWALTDHLLGVFPSRRGPGDRDAAPDDVAGLLISLHSAGNLILWPWGYTTTPVPNAADLAGLGRKLAALNGYTPLKITDLTRGSGSTDDWVYGTFGIPSYTFEIGPDDGPCNDFTPPATCLDGGLGGNFWGVNRPALRYAARIARAPYQQARGPDALTVTATLIGTEYRIDATIGDSGNGQPGIQAAEAYLDAPPWAGGTPRPLLPRDGAFDSSIEAVTGFLAESIPKTGRPIYVRGQDTAGNWGPVGAAWLLPQAAHFPIVGQS